MTFTPRYNEYQFILNSDLLTAEQKVKALQKLKENIDSQLKDKLVNDLIKKWSGGLLELASSAIPFGGAGKAGASIGGNVLKKTLGRKLSQEIGSGAMSGMASGAVFGAGQGMIEDKNPLELAVQYGASGLLLGGLTGGVAGKIIQDKNIKYVNELADKRKDWGIVYRKASGNPELAIQTLLENKKGFVPDAFNKRGVGNVDLVWGKEGKQGYGLAHIAEKRAKEGYDVREFLNNIPDNVKNGKIIPKKNQSDISLIKNSENTSIIKKLYNDKKRNWLLTSFNDYEKIPNNIGRTPDIADNYVGMTPPTYSGKTIESQAVTGRQTSVNSYPDKQPLPLSDLGINNSIITDNVQTGNPSFKILPAWLSALFLSKNQDNSDLLQENLPLNIPVLKGNVQMDVNIEDLTNLVNPETIKNPRIDEFENHQVVMDEQTGVPSNSENGCWSNDTVYVHPYTRDDGTEVKGYYRSKPSRI